MPPRFCFCLFCFVFGAGGVPQVPDADVSAEEVEGLVTEADAYSLTSHLLWAMWALLQSKVRLGVDARVPSIGSRFPSIHPSIFFRSFYSHSLAVNSG